MGLKTPLYDTHVREGAKLVDFGGWDMPLHYGSQLEEHQAVRRDCGVFDVSHMAVVDLTGDRVRDFLRLILANDVARLTRVGKALYSCMLRPDGGVIDDLIAYYLSPTWFRLVVNAGCRDKDLAWIRRHAHDFGVAVIERTDLGILAVQGPNAIAKTVPLLPSAQRATLISLGAFAGQWLDSWFVARTGYTGEDGLEIMLPGSQAAEVWGQLRAQSVRPVGLGARDTLRLEAGMNLYGNDMDENFHPLESALEWTVAFDPPDRDFFGRKALQTLSATGGNELVGLILEDRGVLRGHQPVITDMGAGTVTSGTFSPTLNRSIGLARVPRGCGSQVQADIRGKLHAARIVKPPFVRRGRILIELE